jgi:tetratricopeptide (TPR) repeat protein
VNRLIRCIVCTTLALTPAIGFAQSVGHKDLAAEALFAEGRELMAEGKLESACRKFEESASLRPSPGTLLNAAVCAERLGRTATAWSHYRKAAAAARAANQHEREKVARERGAALLPKLNRLNVKAEGDLPEKLEIVHNAQPLERGAWGVALPVDPGTHVIRVSAPGYEPWETRLVIENVEAQLFEVAIPPLRPLPAARPVAQQPSRSEERNEESSGSPMQTWGVVVGGLGVAALAAGGLCAWKARTDYDDAKARCHAGGCPDSARSDAEDARDLADLATVFVGVGAVALGTGSVLWILAPGKDGQSVGTVGLQYNGTF